jgi:hypothetical protein
MKNKVKAFYNPPSLLFRQLGSILLMGYLNRWRNFPGWLFKHGFPSIPVSNGAWGMGHGLHRLSGKKHNFYGLFLEMIIE